MNDKDEWGNLELPGLSDEQLFKPKVNVLVANKIKGKKFAKEGTFKGKNNPRYGIKIAPENHPRGMLGKNHDNSNKEAMAHKGEKNGMYGVRLTGEQNGFYQKTHTDEVAQRIREVALSREKSHHCEHCDGHFTAQAYSQHHGDYCEHNPNRIIKERKKMAKEICPHCGIEAAPKAFARLHGDNCKHKKLLEKRI